MTHPQPLGDFRDATAVFWLAKAVNDGTFKIADFDGLLFCGPMSRRAEMVPRLDVYEAEFRSVERAAP
jgi:hypothetical protein